MHKLIGWLNRLVIRILFFVPLLVPCLALAQQLSLNEAHALATRNYPLIRQRELIRETADISVENLRKGFLPQVSINGQASYQSDITRVEIAGARFKMPPSKDQYNIAANISQLVYDGGVTRYQKEIHQLNAIVEDQKIEVELYNLKERINQIYLSVLYLDEQVKQVDLVKEDLQIGIKKVEAQVKNGVAFKSNLNTLMAESLKANQRLIELTAGRKGLIETLGLFLNQKLDENIVLDKPMALHIPIPEIDRPEIKLLSGQSEFLLHQKNLIQAKNLPKTSLFVQGGYGRPGLNLLKNEFDPYFIGGLRLSWSLGNLYTAKKEKLLVDINRKIIDIQKETFLLNTNTQLKQQQSEIEKLDQLIASDMDIIELRKNITVAAKAQLEYGVITANDYLREVNAEDQARQTLITHQLQLLQAQIKYQTIIGK